MTHGTQPRQTPPEDPEAASSSPAVSSPGRFSRLPERIRPEDTVETKPATVPDPARDTYNPDEWLIRYCG
ncbi:hypothetical protein [Streptomyces collinus]|uniref:hypothetical protein n=1 Tax=Streptomyces collinus TaxID=42684 RepID=UPI002943F43D|nr:hypothetical protein [Streptomyces collinus]